MVGEKKSREIFVLCAKSHQPPLKKDSFPMKHSALPGQKLMAKL